MQFSYIELTYVTYTMHSTGTNYTVHSITGNPKTCGFGKLICSLMTNDIACYIIRDITKG